MFFSILLFSNRQSLRLNTLNSLNSLNLTLITPSNSLSQTLTSLSHCHWPDSILNVTGPPKLDVINLFRRTPKLTQAPSRRSMPQTHASDLPPIHASNPSWPSLMLSILLNSFKLSPLNSHLSVLPLPLPIHTFDPTRL